jgi:hypothetical protein
MSPNVLDTNVTTLGIVMLASAIAELYLDDKG